MTTVKQQAIQTANDSATAAFQQDIVLTRSVIAVTGGSFTEDYVKTGATKGKPYLKGTMLGFDGKQFSTQKIVNLYFVQNDAGQADMDFLLNESKSGTLYMVAGGISIIENDMSDSVSIQISNAEICTYSADGFFEADGIVLEGEADAMVTKVVGYRNTFNVAALSEERGGIRTKSISLKENEAMRDAQRKLDLEAAYSGNNNPVAAEMLTEEAEELAFAD
jgi:hypothetical protein